MNRGYNNIVDTKSVSFWVIPWKLVVIGLIVLILIIWFFIWIFGHIQWKRTPSNPTPQSNSNSPMTPSSGFPKKSEAPPMQRPPTQR
jgi:flagellar biogenesis protein FliO